MSRVKISLLQPGDDPTRKIDPAPRPSCSGCLIKIGIVAFLIGAAGWLISNNIPRTVAEVPTVTPTVAPTWTAEYLSPTPSPSVLPTDTPQPTATPRPTLTGTASPTPPWNGCTTDTCRLIVGAPGYDATHAMSVYRTAVAPLTPSSTPTRTPSRTPTRKPAPRSSGGGGGSSRPDGPSQPQSYVTRLAPGVIYLTAIPAIPATVAPTITPMPTNCPQPVTCTGSFDPSVPAVCVTATLPPACQVQPVDISPTPGQAGTLAPLVTETPMEVHPETSEVAPIPVSETPTQEPTAIATAEVQ